MYDVTMDRGMLWHPTLQEEIFHIWGSWHVIVALMGVFHIHGAEFPPCAILFGVNKYEKAADECNYVKSTIYERINLFYIVFCYLIYMSCHSEL
jgi:hypothetical protein